MSQEVVMPNYSGNIVFQGALKLAIQDFIRKSRFYPRSSNAELNKLLGPFFSRLNGRYYRFISNKREDIFHNGIRSEISREAESISQSGR